MQEKPRRVHVHPSAARGLLEQIRGYAADSENVAFSNHALERMEERDITDVEVIRVLQQGSIAGSPWVEERKGDMACKVVQRQPCGRSIGVVTIIITPQGRLLVKTVEWEDVK